MELIWSPVWALFSSVVGRVAEGKNSPGLTRTSNQVIDSDYSERELREIIFDVVV